MSLAAAFTFRARRRREGLDLKWVLVRRILLVAILCMTGGGALVLRDLSQQSAAQNAEAAERAARQLSLQLTRIDAALDRPDRFPDWDVIVNYALHPGQCLQFVASGQDRTHSSCRGADVQSAPEWFVAAYKTFPGSTIIELPLSHKGKIKGIVTATTEATAVADRAWIELSRLIGIGAVMILAMCFLVYVVVERALRPTTEILAGLNRLADGNLMHRLPRFKMRELDRIADVFNNLAQKLEATTHERSELARKLVNAQEQERRHIARELHDDVAQRLSVVNSLASSIKRACKKIAPAIAKQSEELIATASGTMRSLRETLTYLRPSEIDDLGLLPSVQVLVEDHNRRARGDTKFSLEADGRFDDLPAETAAHIYRIVQEGLNNAARHANARNVRVVIASTMETQAKARHIDLSVIDDGANAMPSTTRDRHSGIGLAGIRERVYALSGTCTAQQTPTGGFELRVRFAVRVDAQEAA